MKRETVQQVLGMIERNEIAAAGKSMTIGFDGFVDAIVRIVQDRDNAGRAVHFRHKGDFGQHLVDRAAHNASFELTEVVTKIGGNMPITAHALGRLGMRVDCIGMLGHPKPHALFAAMDPNCTLHSFAEPTHSTALEFDDGKVLLANGDALRSVTWTQVQDALGVPKLIELYRDADAIGFANWGEIEQATEIWEGIEREVLSRMPRGKTRLALFDLADSSRRTAADAARLAALIGRVSASCETVLCLNRNEAFNLHHLLRGDGHAADLEAAGAALHAALDVHTLIIRHPRRAIAWGPDGVRAVDTFFVEQPLLSTGGGDNFNAGYAFARLGGIDIASALVIAAAVSGFYVTTGDSPTLKQLSAFLSDSIAATKPLTQAEAAS